jgi:hypothetical protein
MGKAQGKKVEAKSVAAQTIKAQPVFGQIEPSLRPCASRAENAILGEGWLISNTSCKKLKRLGVEKEAKTGKGP